MCTHNQHLVSYKFFCDSLFNIFFLELFSWQTQIWFFFFFAFISRYVFFLNNFLFAALEPSNLLFGALIHIHSLVGDVEDGGCCCCFGSFQLHSRFCIFIIILICRSVLKNVCVHLMKCVSSSAPNMIAVSPHNTSGQFADLTSKDSDRERESAHMLELCAEISDIYIFRYKSVFP